MIEVVWTGGGIDKLEIYRRLGIGEVWVWKGDRIDIHALRRDRYEQVRRSRLLPDLDVGLLVSFLDRATALQAVKAFSQALGKTEAPRNRGPPVGTPPRTLTPVHHRTIRRRRDAPG